MSDTPLITVAIPTTGHSPYLTETLASVKAALIPNMEIMIVDNSGVGKVRESILAEAGLEGRIVRQSSQVSIGDNWNRCILESKGKWVHILHDDDWITPDYYKECQADVVSHPTLGFWVCGVEEIDPTKSFVRPLILSVSGVVNDKKIVADILTNSTSLIQCVSVVLRKEAMMSVGMFDPNLKIALDRDGFLRCGYYFGFYSNIRQMGFYRINESSILGQGLKVRSGRRPLYDNGVYFNDIRHISEKYIGTESIDYYMRKFVSHPLVDFQKYYLRRKMIKMFFISLFTWFRFIFSSIFPRRIVKRNVS